MSVHHPARIALIDDTGRISHQSLVSMANNLTGFVEKKFGPVWNARGEVAVYTEQTKPAHAWPIHIKTRLNQPGAFGYHTDQNGQPVIYVEATADTEGTCAHETMEALADPQGSRLHPAPLPPPQGVPVSEIGSSTVQYLVEVCDPPEAVDYDFILPSWYSEGSTPGRYSYAGTCTAPRQVADGGYCSFMRPDNEWFQVFAQSGSLQVSSLGKFSKADGFSLREWVDSKAREHRAR